LAVFEVKGKSVPRADDSALLIYVPIRKGASGMWAACVKGMPFAQTERNAYAFGANFDF